MTWTTRPRSDHATLSAITAGQGATVVFIHGVGLRAEAWGAQLDALSPHYRVVAVDMPGHGGSALPRANWVWSTTLTPSPPGLTGR